MANRAPRRAFVVRVVGDVAAAVVEGDPSHEAADAAGATHFGGERGGGEEDVAGVTHAASRLGSSPMTRAQ